MILLWRISTKCNFGCGFCAYDRNLAMARADADPSEVARVVRLFHELASQRQVRLHVSWLGGEPFCGPRFWRCHKIWWPWATSQ